MCVHFVERDLQAWALIEDMKGAIQVTGEQNKTHLLIENNSLVEE